MKTILEEISRHYQPSTKRLDEAGSYESLCPYLLRRAAARLDQKRRCKLWIQADEGGVSFYGRNVGRYPIDRRSLSIPVAIIINIKEM